MKQKDVLFYRILPNNKRDYFIAPNTAIDGQLRMNKGTVFLAKWYDIHQLTILRKQQYRFWKESRKYKKINWAAIEAVSTAILALVAIYGFRSDLKQLILKLWQLLHGK